MESTHKENLAPNLADASGADSAWQFFSPRENLTPDSWASADDKTLSISGIGKDRDTCLGWWKAKMPLKDGAWYEASVNAEITGLNEPVLAVLPVVCKRLLQPVSRDGDLWTFSLTFQMLPEYEDDEILLMFRWGGEGTVTFSNLCVCEIQTPAPRTARVAAVKMDFANTPPGFSIEDSLSRVYNHIDEAGALNCDIVCFTEFAHICGVSEDVYKSWDQSAQKIDGELCQTLSKQAKKNNIHVICGFCEDRDGLIYNTAVLFGRDGQLIGQYDKTHLTSAEYMAGISPGTSYPIFDLDFGRIAISICYDQYFYELFAYYAHKGVEIVFHPVMGGKPIGWRSRSQETGIYTVCATWSPPACVIESSGAFLAQSDCGIAYYDLDMNTRLQNVYRDPRVYCGMAGLRVAMRNRIDHSVLDEYYKMAKNCGLDG